MSSTSHPSNPRPDRLTARLSAREAADLAGQVAALAQAGLPLGPGLRAVAEELPGSREAAVLILVAADLDTGKPLDQAIAAQADSFPAHLRRLIVAGVQSGRLAQVQERFVAAERQRMELHRRIWANLAYPLLLLVIVFVLSGLMVHWLLPQVKAVYDSILRMFADFGTTLPAVVPMATNAMERTLVLGRAFFWLTLNFLGIAFLLWGWAQLGSPLVWRWLLDRLPLVGSIWRWSRLAQFSRLMEVLVGEAVPLPEALRLSGEALQASDLARACRKLAARVEMGETLEASVAGLPQFPPTLVPFLQWGRESNHLDEAFRAAAESFEGRIQGHVALLESLALPATLLLVLVAVISLLRAFFVLALPMISLVKILT